MKKGTRYEAADILVPILYGIVAIAIAMLVCWSGQYPYGSETMSYIYKADLLYNKISEGSFLVLYDNMWYNGVEFFTAGAPLPIYFIAACQAIAGGDPTDGYLVYVGLVFFISAVVWFIIARKKNRVIFGSFLGVLWFFMPNNLYEMFFAGNLARAFCTIMIPLFIAALYDYLEEGGWKKLLQIIIVYLCILLSDYEYAVMVMIAAAIFVIIYCFMYNKWKRAAKALLAVVIAFIISGLWSIPYVLAYGNADSTETMYRYFQDIFKTLNPFERYISVNRYYYFGLAAFILAAFGVLSSKKKTIPGFVTALIILAGTVASMYEIVLILPGKNNLLMCQYISIALCLILFAFLKWDSLRKPIQIFLCILLVADTVPSLNLIYGTMSGVALTERYDEQDETTLIAKAKELCQQRIAYFDGDAWESTGNWLVTGYENKKMTAMGADWDTAVIKSNLAQLNKALKGGFYDYFFDRCKELGNDTIIVKLSEINAVTAPVEELDYSAGMLGYKVAGSNEFYRLYNLPAEGNWGTTAKYPAIGIGTNAADISLSLPAVKEVSSTNLNDYTFEELSQYELIYLAGFTYDDKQSAEELILKLSEAGVRIVILADGIPTDRGSDRAEFLGTACNGITFQNGYPLLNTKVGTLDCDFFPQGYQDWHTVYVTGLDNSFGSLMEEGLELDFCGTVKNDNIYVVGLNLTYYYSLTKDAGVGKLLSLLTDYPVGKLPERKLVPLTVEYSGSSLKITSKQDNVNTSLAFNRLFSSDKELQHENNLLYVNSGITDIELKYPYLYMSAAVSLLGLILAAVFCAIERHNELKAAITAENETIELIAVEEGEQPDSEALESTSGELESEALESTGREPESAAIESTGGEPEGAAIESTGGEPEGAAIESTGGEPEHTAIESAAREPESAALESAGEQPESTSADVISEETAAAECNLSVNAVPQGRVAAASLQMEVIPAKAGSQRKRNEVHLSAGTALNNAAARSETDGRRHTGAAGSEKVSKARRAQQQKSGLMFGLGAATAGTAISVAMLIKKCIGKK